MQLVPTESEGVKKTGAARDGAASAVLTMAMGKVSRVILGGPCSYVLMAGGVNFVLFLAM